MKINKELFKEKVKENCNYNIIKYINIKQTNLIKIQ